MRHQMIPCASIVVLALVMAGGEVKAQDQWRPPIQSGQGTTLHGTRSPAHENLNIPLTQQDGRVFTFVGGELTAANGAPLVGQTFQDDARTVTLRIEAAVPHKSILHTPDGGTPDVLDPPPVSEYVVTVDGTNICEGKALAVPYGWSDGQLVAPPGQPAYFTFACVPWRDQNGTLVGGGAIAKCVDWGYAPWASSRQFDLIPKIDTTLASYDEEVAKRFHQTCVVMATADYCGENKSNTVNGTPIGIADIQNIANPQAGLATVIESSGGAVLTGTPRPGTFPVSANAPVEEQNDPLVLEAVWGFESCDGGGGRLYTPNGVPCSRARVLCISRARWATLSLAATCLNEDTANLILNPCRDTSQRECRAFCDDWTLDDLRAKRATLFSYSASWDKALVSFHADERWITTAMVGRPRDAVTSDRNGFLLALPNPPAGGPFTEVRYEGKLFKSSIPASVKAGLGPLVPLYRCKRNGEYVLARGGTTSLPGDTASLPCPAGYGPDGPVEAAIEGLIYAPDHPDARDHDPLYLWRKTDSTGARFVTSRIQPDGYVMEGTRPLGYLAGRRQLPPLPLPPPARAGCATPGGRGALSLAPVLGVLLLLANGGRSLRRRYRRTTPRERR